MLSLWAMGLLLAQRPVPTLAATVPDSAACAHLKALGEPVPVGDSFADRPVSRPMTQPNFVVREATLVPAGRAPGMKVADEDPAELPDHCLFRATLSPRAGPAGETFGISFELRMPLTWNGRFVFEGGGGMDGLEFPAYGSLFGRLSPVAVARGFAVVRTDSGHRGTSMDDGHFALDQQARIDYAFNALEAVTTRAREVITSFYGKPPDHSYFMGCSNGGRQAMSVAERFPLYFDGIVAGDPSFNISHVSVRAAWSIGVLSRVAPKDAQGHPILSRAFSESDLQLIGEAVTKSCDALDGLADGMINDVAACHFDPKVLECHGNKQPGCLSKAQTAALRSVFVGPRDTHGHPLFASFPYDTGIPTIWRGFYLGHSQTESPDAVAATLMLPTLRYHSLTPPAPALDPLTLNVQDVWPRVAQTAALNDADWTFMNTFARHGKLILYQGTSDYGLSAKDLAAWYDRLSVDTGGHTQDWARLFLVPGMGHCSGGRATDQFDPLMAIQDWVEGGKPPDRILATGSAFPGQSRPLCAWPKVARYGGGDPKQADSFVCR
jgi:tannase/feruloyl esterase